MFKKIIATIVSFIGGFLGAWGGAEGTSKTWRRIGIPALLSGVGVGFKKFKTLIIGAWSGIASIGYGIPGPGDEGSTLGKFWYKILKGNHKATDVAVKSTIGFMYALVLGAIGLLRGNLGLLAITAPLAIGSHVIFGGFWQVPGEIKVLGKKLTWNELLRFGTLTCAGVIQILWG